MENRYVWAVGAGILLGLSFPQPGIAGLAWVAPGCILFCGMGRRPFEQFGIGYVAGLAHYLISLRWLLYIPFPAGAVTGWLALSSYMALYPALWVWACWRLFPKNKGMDESAAGAAAWYLSQKWVHRAGWIFLTAVLWTGLEVVVGRLFTGFPWNFLGVSQYRILPLIQVAAWTGVYGVSFLVAWFAVSLVSSLVALSQHPFSRPAWMSEMGLVAAALAGVLAYGTERVQAYHSAGRSLRMALVQPSIPQTLLWDPDQVPMRFDQLLKLSREAMAVLPKPEVLVWPEAAMPPLTDAMVEQILQLVREEQVWMVFGTDDAELRAQESGEEVQVYYNGAFLLSPAGSLAAKYHKRQLVIFGEYIPFERALPFVKHLTPIQGSFSRGERPSPFRLPDVGATASVLICFEDIFPHLGREHAKGADILVNLTNNGWFGESSAQWQHAAAAVFRPIENGIPLVRCANNGLTCWVDAVGRMHGVYFGQNRDIYAAGYKIADVPLGRSAGNRYETVYGRVGDVFGWACAGLGAAALAAVLLSGRIADLSKRHWFLILIVIVIVISRMSSHSWSGSSAVTHPTDCMRNRSSIG